MDFYFQNITGFWNDTALTGKGTMYARKLHNTQVGYVKSPGTWLLFRIASFSSLPGHGCVNSAQDCARSLGGYEYV